ncbi:unnamed protein product, partial [Ectocarpus sp. 8 AP-2014]
PITRGISLFVSLSVWISRTPLRSHQVYHITSTISCVFLRFGAFPTPVGLSACWILLHFPNVQALSRSSFLPFSRFGFRSTHLLCLRTRAGRIPSHLFGVAPNYR